MPVFLRASLSHAVFPSYVRFGFTLYVDDNDGPSQ